MSLIYFVTWKSAWPKSWSQSDTSEDLDSAHFFPSANTHALFDFSFLEGSWAETRGGMDHFSTAKGGAVSCTANPGDASHRSGVDLMQSLAQDLFLACSSLHEHVVRRQSQGRHGLVKWCMFLRAVVSRKASILCILLSSACAQNFDLWFGPPTILSALQGHTN